MASDPPEDKKDPEQPADAHANEAMWGEDELRAAGLDELADLRAKRSEPPPATKPAVGGADSSTIQVDSSQSFALDAQKGKGRPPVVAGGGGLSWPVTITLALALGGIVYVTIRFLL